MTRAIRVGVVGLGYVGLTTAVCLAERGYDTVAIDIDESKIELLNQGHAVIDEPELAELIRAGLSRRLLRFDCDYRNLADREVVFVCVPTPSGSDGAANLGAVTDAVDRLRPVLRPDAVLAMKSTVPVGTTQHMKQRLDGSGIRVAAVPEFLREGRAVQDCRHPDRVVVGASGDGEAAVLSDVYEGAGPILRMTPESAELSKYASNAFLAVKLSYTNSLAELCARVGADICDVTACMGADDRIGPAFLAPGPGWGGSCLPKDTAALVYSAHKCGLRMAEVEAARETNAAQGDRLGAVLGAVLSPSPRPARIAALGLTFKASTSDTRDSPALAVCARLAQAGMRISGYDPQMAEFGSKVLQSAGVSAVDDPYRATKSVDAIVVLTEWPQFAVLDWGRIARGAPAAVVVDTRNTLDSAVVEAAGLKYIGNGLPEGF